MEDKEISRARVSHESTGRQKRICGVGQAFLSFHPPPPLAHGRLGCTPGIGISEPVAGLMDVVVDIVDMVMFSLLDRWVNSGLS